MGKKLYVGGLSYDTTEDALKGEFSQAGTVESASIITDRISGRSKGFGFVEMSSEEEAKKAIEMFNGKELDGRTVTVDEARPMKKRSFDNPSPRPHGGFNRGRRFQKRTSRSISKGTLKQVPLFLQRED